MKPRQYFNHSGALNDPDQPEALTTEQQEALDEADGREVEAAIDLARGDC